MTQFLPPNLLALFAPREPLPFLPPISKLPHERRRIPYSGIGTYVKLFDHPKDIPPPEKQETKAEKKERRRREKAEQMAYIIEQGIALWQPHSNSRATSDPYKTLFVARINYDTSESKLKKEFSEFGSIKKLYLIHNKINGKPRGYAFVEYDHERDMHAAYKRGDGRKIDGKRVVVDVERGRTVKGWLPRRFGGGLGNSRKGPNDTLKDMTRLGSRDKDRDRRKSRSRSKRRKSRSRSRDRKRHTPPRRDRDAKNIKSEPGAVDVIKKEKVVETNGPDGVVDIKKVKKEKKSKRSRSKERKHRSKSRDKEKSSKKDRHRDKEKRRRDKSGDRDNDKDISGVEGGFTGFPPIKKEKFDSGYEKYANSNASAANHSFAGTYNNDEDPNQTLNSQSGLTNEANYDGTVDSLEQYYYNNSSNANNLSQAGDDSMLMQNYGQP